MRLARRLLVLAFVAAYLSSCAYAPRGASSSVSPSDSSTPPPSGNTEPTPTAATPAPSPTDKPTESAGPADLSSAAWFQWVTDESGDSFSLYAGRLDGRAFRILGTDSKIEESSNRAGPVGGFVLSQWFDGDETVLTLVDSADGTDREMVRSQQRLWSGGITPDGRYVLWTSLDESGRVSGVWRQATARGQAEKVVDGWNGPGPNLHFSLDGSHIVFSHRSELSDGYSYRLFDADLVPAGQLLDTDYGPVIGFLGDRLLVYASGVYGEALAFPIVALNLDDWSAETVVSSEGIFAAILPDADGTPRLVFDGHDEDDRYVLHILDADGSSRALYVGEAPWYGPLVSMVVPTTSYFVVAPPGWVAVLPGGRPIPPPALVGGDEEPRLLIRMSDGETVQVPALGAQ